MPPGHEDHRRDIERIMQGAVKAADPAQALRLSWKRAWERRDIDLDARPPVLILGMGKASLEMAAACLELLPHPVHTTLIAAVPERIGTTTLPAGRAGRCRIMPADHPLPSNRSHAFGLAVQETIAAFTREHGERGVVIALISGGGSSHMALPAGQLTIDDLREANRLMQSAGASISQLNCIRRHTEVLKGGGLAALAHPARIQVFVASDVIGDPLHVIASGPFASDASTFADALRVADRYRLQDRTPRIIAHLRQGTLGRIPETVKPANPSLQFTRHWIICNNQTALDGAAAAARELGFEVLSCGPMQESAAGAEGERLSGIAAMDARSPRSVPAIRLIGGEPTVDTRDAPKSDGLGGPSQELALAAALRFRDLIASHDDARASRTVLAAFSTDGIDGPTDAAGAIIPVSSFCDPADRGFAARAALAHHDSHRFLDAAGMLIRTGPTGVNANHVACAVVYPQLP